MQNNTPLRTLLITCGALIIIAAGIYAYLQRTPAGGEAAPIATSSVSGLPDGATVTDVPLTQAPKAPDFRKPVAYDASVSAEVRASIERRLAADMALLAKNTQNFNVWLDLALLYKIGGDYRGAEAAWLYVTKIWPTSYVAFHNLGDLYQNFLKDTAKADFYFAEAARRTPKQ